MANNSRVIQNHLKKLKSDVEDHPIDMRFYIDDSNIKHIYFCVYGVKDSPYYGGRYYGELILPEDFPFGPPRKLIMHTPSGRYSIGKEICLTNTAFHAESWSPMWGIYRFMLGFLSTFNDSMADRRGVAHLQCSDDEICKYAAESDAYNVKHYSNTDSTTVLGKIDYIFKNNPSVFPPVERTMHGTGLKDSPKLSVNPTSDSNGSTSDSGASTVTNTIG